MNQDLGQSDEAATQGFPEVGGLGRDSYTCHQKSECPFPTSWISNHPMNPNSNASSFLNFPWSQPHPRQMNSSFICDPIAICVFLFNQFTRSYCGNLFTQPFSQSPKVDSVIIFFYFQCLAKCPALEDVLCIIFWHWKQGTWLCSLCTAQLCPARACKISWDQSGHLLICTKALCRLSVFPIGRANQTQQNVRRNSTWIGIVPLLKVSTTKSSLTVIWF